MPASTRSGNALDRLKKAANLVPVKKVVVLSNGDEFEFWHTPLTMAERERAEKGVKDDLNGFALQLFVQKATDETGQNLFQMGQIAELKHEVRDADLQSLMVAVLSEAEEQVADPKN